MPDYALMNQLLYEGNAVEVKSMTEEALEKIVLEKDIKLFRNIHSEVIFMLYF